MLGAVLYIIIILHFCVVLFCELNTMRMYWWLKPWVQGFVYSKIDEVREKAKELGLDTKVNDIENQNNEYILVY